MTDIPVTFLFQGKELKGFFSQVMGAGSTANFHLMINSFYYGQLFYTENHGWQFGSNLHPELNAMAEDFGLVVTSWLDSHG